MSNRHDPPPPTRIEIDADASMPMVLTELRRHFDESVVLAVPDQCPVLLTVAEFRALKDTADRAGVNLTLETGVSLRNQLATMFGIRTTAGTNMAASGWRPPDTLLSNSRAYESWVQQDDDDDQPPPARRRRGSGGGTPESSHSQTRREPQPIINTMDYIEDDDSSTGATARLIGKITAGVLVVALIAVVAAWYALPNVTVRVTQKSTTISSEVNYAVAADGASLPSDIVFSVEARTAEADVPITISVPTTGVKRTPQETARGEVLLRNPTAAEIVVPQGTTLSIFAGTSYTTDSEVTVPPAANNVAGETTVSVTAMVPGTDGNAEAGLLTGVVSELGVYYSNRDGAIEGGTDIEEPIVDEADVTALRDKVINDYNRAAAVGWNSQLPDGQSVVEPSVQAQQPNVDAVTAEVGASAEEITFTATVHATGLIYDQTEVDSQTTEYFRQSMQEQLPNGYVIDPDSVTLTAPMALVATPTNVQFRVTGTATAYAQVYGQLLDQLRSDLAGSSWEEAQTRLDGVDQFESYDMSRSPSWWFARMPRDRERIDIVVVDHAQATPIATAGS